jgi:hypothetical protein
MATGEPQSGPGRRPRRRLPARLPLVAAVIALASMAAIGVTAASPGLRSLAPFQSAATHASATGQQHAASQPAASGTRRPIPAFTPPVTCVPIASASPLPACTPCPAVGGLEPSGEIACGSCPPVREGASIPCPLPTWTPAPRPSPPAGSATIWFCPALPVPYQLAPGVIALKGFLCGSHFRPGERVTLTVSGPRGNFSWQLNAGAGGTFMAPLPPALCRWLPRTLVASGNEGSHSNTLTFTPNVCLPTA